MTSKPTRTPFLSLCMIVKDEERFIEQCLDSAAHLVDEMIVYDTGSTDRTVELAEARGATVVRGYWDDDFARARNASLRECRGTWVLWLDADEVIQASSTDTVHDALRRNSRVDAVSVTIQNLDAAEGDFTHEALRLIRRSRMRFVGELHEHPVRRDGREARRARLTQATILHYGYTEEVKAERAKQDRNLRVALKGLEQASDDTDRSWQLINVSRSYASTGDLENALRHALEAVERSTGVNRAYAMRLAVEQLISLERFAEAQEWLDDFAELSRSPESVSYLRGLIELGAHGRGELLAGLDPEQRISEFGFEVPRKALRKNVALAHLACENWDAAATLLGRAVQEDTTPKLWAAAILAHHRNGDDLSRLVDALPRDGLRLLLAGLMTLDDEVRDAFARALLTRFGPDDLAFVAFVTAHASRLDSTEHLLPWAELLRASRFRVACPVIERAKDPAVPPTQRFLAAATAHAAFRDPEAFGLLFQISDLLCDEEEVDAALILEEIAPDLIVT